MKRVVLIEDTTVAKDFIDIYLLLNPNFSTVI
jgi:hypothetical protein